MPAQPYKQKEKDLEALNLYQKGFTLEQIGRALNIHKITAHRRIKRAKVVPSLAEDKLKNNV